MATDRHGAFIYGLINNTDSNMQYLELASRIDCHSATTDHAIASGGGPGETSGPPNPTDGVRLLAAVFRESQLISFRWF